MRRMGERGISTVMGMIFFIIITILPASILFMTLTSYNDATKEFIEIGEERSQESILLHHLETEFIQDIEYIANITLNNTGSIASRIRAVYIDDEFRFDPSETQNTYVDPKKSITIVFPRFPDNIPYYPDLKITVATERGVKSSEYAYLLKGEEVTSGYKFRPYYGPLQLNFDDFKYTECDPKTGSYNDSSWKDGWILRSTGETIVWRINVTNIDESDITINQFSCFTLHTNDQPSDRRVWYIDFSGGSLNMTIKTGEWVHLVYKWSKPKDSQGASTQQIYTTTCRTKTFLTFFGCYEKYRKPYGQTIPFEAVLFT
ncbi:MAG: hypothetical protein ACUVV4_04335 [Candidatus Bathyarchaeia archaeon]